MENIKREFSKEENNIIADDALIIMGNYIIFFIGRLRGSDNFKKKESENLVKARELILVHEWEELFLNETFQDAVELMILSRSAHCLKNPRENFEEFFPEKMKKLGVLAEKEREKFFPFHMPTEADFVRIPFHCRF